MTPGSRTDPREVVGGGLFRLLRPLVRRLIEAGLPAGPNVVLTVRGRRTGRPRTVPIAMLELDGRRFVQASFGEADWVKNLRASDAATLTIRGRSEPVHAIELDPDAGAAVIQRAIGSFPRRRFLRRVLGPTVRPPVGVLRRYRLRIDDTPTEDRAEAERHPLFELRP